MEIHLDLVGGLAGDMFIAAVLDAFPRLEARVRCAIDAVGGDRPVICSLLPHRDRVLTGRRFDVAAAIGTVPPVTSPLVTSSRASSPHASWKSIRTRIEGAALSAGTRRHATAIFQLLAEAEAFVHGIEPADVEFHEVGAWDSIADIVGAAELIDALDVSRWSASPAPLGSGRVETAHGMLPVPAPATARLLIGLPTLDDGVAGERVTPTGAAILRYLCPPDAAKHVAAAGHVTGARTLLATGTGFGRRTLPGLSNHVRVLCFEAVVSSPVAFASAREMGVLEFEVDDQSGEDLAAGLDRLRTQPGVLDVTQAPVFGKKGRMMSHVCVLVRQADLAAVVEACFKETTTIGLRQRTVRGIGLERRTEEVLVEGERLRVKVVDRPGGTTAKTEADDVLGHETHARRAALRRRAERAILDAQQVDLDA